MLKRRSNIRLEICKLLKTTKIIINDHDITVLIEIAATF